MENYAFMKENALEVKNENYVASQKLLDENGQPMEWELRCISGMEDEEIIRSCRGSSGRLLNIDKFKYIGTVMAQSVVYPNLNNAKLQDSYGAKSSEQLLRLMLTTKEYHLLQIKISKLGKNIQHKVCT